MRKQKVAVITGASSRLGRYLVNHLVQQNYFVYAGVNTQRETALFSDPSVTEISLNVVDQSSVTKALNLINKKSGNIDLLINNAALSVALEFETSSIDDFEKLIAVNQVGPLRLMKSFLPRMNKGAKIINITSLNAILPLPKYAYYVSTKFGLLGLSRSLFYELYGKVSVTSIAPGAIQFPENMQKQSSVRGARDKMPLLNILFPFTKPENVLHAIDKILSSKNPPSHVYVGADASLIAFLFRLLPLSIVDRAILHVWKRK